MPRKKKVPPLSVPVSSEQVDKVREKVFRFTLMGNEAPTVEVCTSWEVTYAGALVLFHRQTGRMTRRVNVFAPGTWFRLEEVE